MAARPASTPAAPRTDAILPGPCGTAAQPPSGYDHVIWVVMENKAAAQIIGSPEAPYINELAARCGRASELYGEAHPSLPNYIALTSGSTQGITDDNDPSAHKLGVPSIFSQLAGGWRSLEESMPSNCQPTDSGAYATRHNPAAYYPDVLSRCQIQDVPLGSVPDLAARFTLVTPNLCHDMHDCDVKTGDAWLSTFLGQVFASSEYRAGRTALFLTWDEDDGSSRNRVPTVVVAPSVRPGTVSSIKFTHYSVLRSTEELLGLGFLGGASSAPSMRAAFNF